MKFTYRGKKVIASRMVGTCRVYAIGRTTPHAIERLWIAIGR